MQNTEEMNLKIVKEFLDEKYIQYAKPDFIETDPIQIPHLFEKKEDIEISGFLAATIAWGQRPIIIRNAMKIIKLMNNSPYEFVMNHEESDLEEFDHFKHRTFNAEDLKFFFRSLKNIYQNEGGLQAVFEKGFAINQNISGALINFRDKFFEIPHLQRTQKHVSNISQGASAKRLNMFLRWMVRPATENVDFGLWTGIPVFGLHLPLDLHTGNTSRKLGLLNRKQNDWKSVLEVTENLKEMDNQDPVKYDFALFGLGIFEKF
jgi:uncharacterized protein (TIGR02757 family)